LIKKIWI
jgi:hypothetical protein